jgi:hypothetical protein
VWPRLADCIAPEVAENLIYRIAKIRLIQTVAEQHLVDRAREIDQGPGPEAMPLRSS